MYSMLHQLGDALRVVDYADPNIYVYVVECKASGRCEALKAYSTADGAIDCIIEAVEASNALDYDLTIDSDMDTTHVGIYCVYPRTVISATIRMAVKMEGGV